jgi:hypothetical protein
MEPIFLRHFLHQRVASLAAALKLVPTGSALVYTFERPRSLFVGTIPRQVAVLWRYDGQQELRVASAGCTFFTWRHATELLVVTGLLLHTFALSTIDVAVTLHVFDPVKFASSVPVDQVRDDLEGDVRGLFRAREDADFASKEFRHYLAEGFFALNRKYQRLGLGITRITPSVRLRHS